MRGFFVVLLVSSVVVSGCAGEVDVASSGAATSPTAVSLTELRVVDKGFTVWEGPDNSYLSWGVVLENPNGGYAARDVTLSVQAVGQAGERLGTEEVEKVPLVRPGSVGWAREHKGGLLSQGGYSFMSARAKEPSQLEVRVSVGSWVPVSSLPKGALEPRSVQVVIAPDDIPSEVVTAEAHSTYREPQDGVSFVAVFRDDAGRIVGGARSITLSIPPDGPTPVRVEDRERLVSAKTADASLVSPT